MVDDGSKDEKGDSSQESERPEKLLEFNQDWYDRGKDDRAHTSSIPQNEGPTTTI